jgi:hypothetical protein
MGLENAGFAEVIANDFSWANRFINFEPGAGKHNSKDFKTC